VVRVVNISTGFAAGTRVRRDRFLVQGLEPGGPYVVEVRHVGFLPQRSQPLRLVLGEPLDLAFVLQPSAIQLGTIQVSAPERSDGGTATTGSGSTGTPAAHPQSQLLRLRGARAAGHYESRPRPDRRFGRRRQFPLQQLPRQRRRRALREQ
jgi:hypothetical protein